MQLIISDTATAALAALGAKLADRQPIAQAAGDAVAQLARRSFTEEDVRAAPWAPLDPSTLAQKLASKSSYSEILRSSGILWRSWRVTAVSADSVTVGSDRVTKKGNLSLAAIHQFGTSRGIPSRPMLPLTGGAGSPQFTELAVRDMLSAVKGALGLNSMT